MLARIFFLIIVIGTQPLYSQSKKLRFMDSKTGAPVTDADVYADSIFVASTDFIGYVTVDMQNDFKKLIIDHIAYEKLLIPYDSLLVNRVYRLKKSDNVLDEVVVNSKTKEDSLVPPYANFTHGMKTATLIQESANSYITHLKFRVVSPHGVKGLNFLPFKANVYEMDSITHLPGKPLLPQDVLVENKGGDKWATVDISDYKIQIPPQGACIVCIIPHYDEGLYETFWIWSKLGLIDAVPFVKYRRTFGKGRSYRYISAADFSAGNKGAIGWKIIDKHEYIMEAEVKK